MDVGDNIVEVELVNSSIKNAININEMVVVHHIFLLLRVKLIVIIVINVR